MLQWTWWYGYHFESESLLPLGKYTEADLLTHMPVLFLIFQGKSIGSHNSCTSLYSHWQYISILFSLHSNLYFISCPFAICHFNRCEVIFYYSLICISLMTSDIEHLFMYLLATCMCSLEKLYSNTLPTFYLIFIGM